MKKIFTALSAIFISVALPLFVATPGVYATHTSCGVETSIIDCGDEEGIDHVLGLVVEIMSIGVGILGVVGITIVGIQYLTAGGSEEKTRKAKRRLVEILIGLALYAVMAALLTWLNVDKKKEASGIKSDTVVALIKQ